MTPWRSITIFRILLTVLFLCWLVIFCTHPVVEYPDSVSYRTDAVHLAERGYHTIRPIMFPALLKLNDGLGFRLSIVCYIFNTASLLCFFWVTGGRRDLLNRCNIVLLACFFLMPAIWSYCGTCLTESILFGVVIWIFLLLARILFPSGRASLPGILACSIAINILAITLKPWIEVLVVLCSIGLFFQSFLPVSLRTERRATGILMVITLLSFLWSYRYNESKSPSSANIGILLISSGKINDLKERWEGIKGTKDTATESAYYIKALISDIELINSKYNGNPYDVADPLQMQVLRLADRTYTKKINKAFKVAYFERLRDIKGLLKLSLNRYVKDISLGTSCLTVYYGPYIPGFKDYGLPVLAGILLLWFSYFMARKNRPKGNKGDHQAQFVLYRDRRSLLSMSIMFLCTVIFALLLCIAGGVELPRTVLPAVLFQLLIISYFLTGRREASEAIKKLQGPEN